MADEFERIMGFFDLNPEEKEQRLQEVFEDSIAYFERFKYIMTTGTSQQRQEAVEHVMMMKKRIEEETKKIYDKTGMSEAQLVQFSNDPQNFSPAQWEALESAKKKLERGMGEIKKTVEKSVDKRNPNRKKMVGREMKVRKPKNWIQS